MYLGKPVIGWNFKFKSVQDGKWTKAMCNSCGLRGIYFKLKGNPHCTNCSSKDINSL